MLRLVSTAAVAAQAVLVPLPAAAAPGSGPSVAGLLTDLQRLYRQAEQAGDAYRVTEERLRWQRAEVARLDGALARARLALHDSRGAAGRLARQQYQSSTGLPSSLRLLLARDPQHALEEDHVVGQVARERAEAVGRVTGGARRADELARQARRALDEQLALAERRKRELDTVRDRLGDVEELLSSLDGEQLAALAALERDGVAEARRLVAAGALGTARAAAPQDASAVRYAVEQPDGACRESAGRPGPFGRPAPDGAPPRSCAAPKPPSGAGGGYAPAGPGTAPAT
ncbi:hypothetical protein GCM10010389_12340 [Streptomyces echinoruber]|uniref:Uncharacterized protein n=1 Tax=Streptomyces echinoruber TaxID=68898 RepID=A0A918R0T3_9ACTN|nr:hypothetical protein GCM10010389_12340 [Streptomyces echinoruber]